jgi:hypothetical protein
MNWINPHLSRRTFLFSTAAGVASFSTAAAVASSIFHQTDQALHVSIIGFGRHAQRFLDSVTDSVLYIDAVFDPDPLALKSASALLKKRQRFLPELVRTSSPSSIAPSSSPVILCSPPHTWAALIPNLTAHGRPVLAHHTQLFAPPYWPESLSTLSRQPANLLVVGIDPTFPLHLLYSFHTFARSRGALNPSYSLWHHTWPQSQLLAFHFDCLNAALPQDVNSVDHQWRFLPMALQPDSPDMVSHLCDSASCSISASGPGIAFGAHLEITGRNSTIASSPGYVLEFANFCRVPQPVRNRILHRQSALLKLVHASTEAMSLFV